MAKTTPVEDVTADDILNEITPATLSVWICTKGDIVEQIQHLEREMYAQAETDAMSNEPDGAPAIARQIQELEAEAKRYEREFVLTDIGHKAWSDLKGAHRPTSAQLKQDPSLDHNPETFWAAALPKSLIKPSGFTPEKVAKLAEKLSAGGWMKLIGGCEAVNEGQHAAPFSRAASMVLRISEKSTDSPAS